MLSAWKYDYKTKNCIHSLERKFLRLPFKRLIVVFQAAAIRFEVRGGDWRQSFMQMDGEPWKQPLDKEYSTFVEIKRVPFQSLMIRDE